MLFAEKMLNSQKQVAMQVKKPLTLCNRPESLAVWMLSKYSPNAANLT